MSKELIITLVESKRVRLKQDEILVIGRIAEYDLSLYAESCSQDTEARGKASRVYALYRKLATRLLSPKSSYKLSFNPSEQSTLLYLINEYYHLLGPFEQVVAYKLREELELK